MALLYYREGGNGNSGAICPSFVTHGVTHNKKGPTAIAVSPCFKWSGREDLNLRPPAPKAGYAITPKKIDRKTPLNLKFVLEET